MKQIYLLVLSVLTGFAANAQLVPCRPRMCMIDYHYHDDLNTPSNTDMATIKAIKPDILIDNTPGGYWGEVNNGTGCRPLEYKPLGIHVFSYIASGYEETYNQSRLIDSLELNLARIDAITADSAYGVFLDQVTNTTLNASSKAYIDAIYQRCQLRGLKLILNPGSPSFDTWLWDHCDYIMSDEGYNGTRLPSPSEGLHLDKILVVADSVNNAAAAQIISTGARGNGFGYSYACTEYITLPSWLSDYNTLITQPPATPVINANGSVLHSTAPAGNQWYKTTGVLAGANGSSYTASTSGDYYVIVTLDGCTSDTSNIIHVEATGIGQINPQEALSFYPNPASQFVTVHTGKIQGTLLINIYNAQGARIKAAVLKAGKENLYVGDLANGIYFIRFTAQDRSEHHRLIIQK